MRSFGRRAVLGGLGGVALAGCRERPEAVAPGLREGDMVELPFANGTRPVVRFPGKRPLIQMTARPPQLETPFGVFGEGVAKGDLLTPNDAFFVRYSMGQLPLDLDVGAWALAVGGHVARPLSLSLAELKALGRAEIVAVNQCSGNSRGFSEPRVRGGQLAHGAMGNARWEGVPLKAVLDAAGVKAGAVDVVFDGMDRPVLPAGHDFAKSLGVDHARDEGSNGGVLLAWAMNGEPLPFLNGFPLRLVVPGWFGTYWVKHLERVKVLDRPFDGHFMVDTYRMPDTPDGSVPPGTKPERTVPITRLLVRSFITNVADGARRRAGAHVLEGFAFDGGAGIRRVLVSADGGANWEAARLGADQGRYGFRGWRAEVQLRPGAHVLMARAEGMGGEVQPMVAGWNPSGYARHVVEKVRVQVS
jgi:DMSO/TMAO reductase YedYZ molybdopterin-dependent catalytic subunit